MKNIKQFFLYNYLIYTVTVVIFAISCSIEPKPINYGSDLCTFCQMSISDQRYGTEFLTKKGKVYKFDSIECLIHYRVADKDNDNNIYSVLITDYSNPGKFVKAEDAFYIISKNVPSPMGAYLSGFANKSSVIEFQKTNQGDILSWEQTYSRIGK